MFRPRHDTRGTIASRIHTITARKSVMRADVTDPDGMIYENQAFSGNKDDGANG